MRLPPSASYFLGRGRPNPLALCFWTAWPVIAISGKPRHFCGHANGPGFRCSCILHNRTARRVSLFPLGLNYTVPTNPRQPSTGQVTLSTPCSGGPSTASRRRRSGRPLRRPLRARSGAARPNSDSGSAVASAAAAWRRRSRGRLSRPSRARRPSRRYIGHALCVHLKCRLCAPGPSTRRGLIKMRESTTQCEQTGAQGRGRMEHAGPRGRGAGVHGQQRLAQPPRGAWVCPLLVRACRLICPYSYGGSIS